MREKFFALGKGKRYFFYILMVAIFGWFLFMQFFGKNERAIENAPNSVVYTGAFTWEKPDGTSEEISVPGRYDIPKGETMVLVSQLPDDLNESSIALRSSLQDVKLYVDNDLRVSYSTKETRLAGKILPAGTYSALYLLTTRAKNSALN